MAQAADASAATLANRELAAQAIEQGYADGNVATVLSTAATAGYKLGELPTGKVGGIINGVNR